MTRVLPLLALLMVGFAPAPFSKPRPKTLDPHVAAAWQKAGMEIGWYGRTRDGGWQYTTGKPDDNNALTALRWRGRTDPAGISKLPAPDVPFALFLGSAPSLPQLTDEGMKAIARFATLRHLAISGTRVTDAGLKEFERFNGSLQGLSLGSSLVTDEGLKHLVKHQSLRHLWSGNSAGVTDAGLKDVGRLKNLETLNVINTKVTDSGLKHLANLKSLETLFLSATRVTDEGLKGLKGLENLRILTLHSTKATDQGVAALRKALPKLKVLR